MRWNDWTKFRSSMGKLLYVASGRPDCQYVVQGLASFMQKPTKEAWEALRHWCSYLRDTKYDGLLLCIVKKASVQSTQRALDMKMTLMVIISWK